MAAHLVVAAFGLRPMSFIATRIRRWTGLWPSRNSVSMSSAGTGGGPFSPSRPGPVGGESGGGLAFANVLSSGRALISPAAQYGIRKSCQNSDLRRSVGWGMEVQEIHDILQKLPRPT